jgi:hypothetical protein
MNGNLLINCLWYEDILPVQLAEFLELTPEMLYEKIFGNAEFTIDEIRKIVALLGLTETEVDSIFFDGGGKDG